MTAASRQSLRKGVMTFVHYGIHVSVNDKYAFSGRSTIFNHTILKYLNNRPNINKFNKIAEEFVEFWHIYSNRVSLVRWNIGYAFVR